MADPKHVFFTGVVRIACFTRAKDLILRTEKWTLFRAQHIEFSLHTKVTKIINKTHVHLAYFADQNKMLLLPKDTYPSILSIPIGSLLMIISVLQYNEKSKFDPSEELCKVSPPPPASPPLPSPLSPAPPHTMSMSEGHTIKKMSQNTNNAYFKRVYEFAAFVSK